MSRWRVSAKLALCGTGRQQDAHVILWRHDRRPDLRARDTDPEILTCLRHRPIMNISSDDPIWIADDLVLHSLRPSFEDDNFVKLLPLRLVHVHHHDAGFRFMSRCEMLLNKRLAGNRERVVIGASIAPILR